jgi:MFS family permease
MEQDLRPTTPTDPHQLPAGELVKQLSEQTRELVAQELALAKLELTEKAKRAGIGGGMFGAAWILAIYAVGALTACLILALSLAVAGWLAALIVAVVYAAVAGVLALTGKRQVQAATPPVPEETVDSVKEDVRWTKQRAKAAKR